MYLTLQILHLVFECLNIESRRKRALGYAPNIFNQSLADIVQTTKLCRMGFKMLKYNVAAARRQHENSESETSSGKLPHFHQGMHSPFVGRLLLLAALF